MAKLIAIALAVFLVGCTQTAKMTWLRTDGSQGPLAQQQFDTDRTICEGEMQKANLSGSNYCRGIADCIVSGSMRGESMSVVGKGCMAQRGYVSVPEEEVAARMAEFSRQAVIRANEEAAAQKAAARKR